MNEAACTVSSQLSEHQVGKCNAVLVVRSFQRLECPTIDFLNGLGLPFFLLLAATDPMGEEYVTKHAHRIKLNQILVGVKGAEENVRWAEAVLRKALRLENKATANLFVLDDNITSLKIKICDGKGKRSGIDMTKANFLRFLETAFAEARRHKLSIFSGARSPNPLDGKAALADKSHLHQSHERGKLFTPAFDAHVYGGAFGLIVSAVEALDLQVTPGRPSIVGDLERGCRSYLKEGKCMYFPSVAIGKKKMSGGSGRMEMTDDAQVEAMLGVFRDCLGSVDDELAKRYLDLMWHKKWAQKAVEQYMEERKFVRRPKKRRLPE